MGKFACLTATAVLLLSTPVLAEDDHHCTFTTECYDQEACAPSDYEVWLGRLDDRFLMSDIAGERPMVEVEVLDTPDQRSFASLVMNMSVGFLSIFPNGEAFYTVHAADMPPTTITYRGRCEEGQ